MPGISIPIIDQLIHPSIGLLTRTAFPANPYGGPFIAAVPPQNPLVALTYGVVLRIHAVAAAHGRDVSNPVQYVPPLGKCSVLYNDLSGLAIIRQVTDWTYDNQDFVWDEPFPAAFQIYILPDVSIDLFWLQT